VNGQVIGGRWKPLHHALQQSAFADVIGSCGVTMASTGVAGSTANGSALCYVRNDLPQAFTGTIIVEAIHYSTGETTRLSTAPVSLPAGGGAVGFLCAMNSSSLSTGKPDHCPTFDALFAQVGCDHGAADCMLNVTVASSQSAVMSRSILPLTKPSNLHLPAAHVTYTVNAAAAGSSSVSVALTTSATALYVWLSTTEQGRFSDNALVLLPDKETVVEFLSFVKTGTSSVDLEASLRVEHLAMYM
jgi:beta-mannosidase